MRENAISPSASTCHHNSPLHPTAGRNILRGARDAKEKFTRSGKNFGWAGHTARTCSRSASAGHAQRVVRAPVNTIDAVRDLARAGDAEVRDVGVPERDEAGGIRAATQQVVGLGGPVDQVV